jgi:hypothetical protein
MKKISVYSMLGTSVLPLSAGLLIAGTFAHANDGAFHLESPYAFGAYQHKVQLHAHTTDSDGDHSGEWVMQAYQDRGYVAVAKTDHDHRDHTPSLDDPGGHGITHIPSLEYSGDNDKRSFAHMLGINIRTIYHEEGVGNRPAQIDHAKKEAGFTYICHPYEVSIHRRGWSYEQIIDWVDGFTGMEINNGRSYIGPEGRNYPTKIDCALTNGKEIKVIAVDDFHRNAEETMDRGCVVINSDLDKDSIRLDSVIDALRTGNYFATGRIQTSNPQPPYFTDITVSGPTIAVTTDREVDIQFITDKHNYYRPGTNFSQLNVGVREARYTASPDDKWIRIQATCTDENGNKTYAWSNPIYVRLGEGSG